MDQVGFFVAIRKYLVFFCISLSIVLVSCSTPRPSGKTEAEVIFREAKVFIKEGRYILANEKLNSIRSKYPYSYYATHAELLQADILYEQESFVEAAASYILFKDLHPKNKRLDYVMYKIAESFYNQLPSTFDRDLTPGREAIKYYNELLNRFPNSSFTKGSVEKIKKCRELLEKKELYIADFYFKTEVYDSARYRYLGILRKIKTEKLRDHSMVRILKSSLFLGEYQKCMNYYDSYKDIVSKNSVGKLNDSRDECKGKIK